MTGRPSSFTDEIATTICERLIAGQTLREVCRAQDMPAPSTVFAWLAARPEFAEQYARACEIRADTWADEIVEIADDATNDWMERDGREFVNADHVTRSRLRIDARKWLMAKAAPKKYGDRVAHEVGGKDGGALVVEIVRFGQDPAPE